MMSKSRLVPRVMKRCGNLKRLTFYAEECARAMLQQTDGMLEILPDTEEKRRLEELRNTIAEGLPLFKAMFTKLDIAQEKAVKAAGDGTAAPKAAWPARSPQGAPCVFEMADFFYETGFYAIPTELIGLERRKLDRETYPETMRRLDDYLNRMLEVLRRTEYPPTWTEVRGCLQRLTEFYPKAITHRIDGVWGTEG